MLRFSRLAATTLVVVSILLASRAPAADDPSAVGPVLGPLREVRTVAATMIATVFGGADPATALAAGGWKSSSSFCALRRVPG